MTPPTDMTDTWAGPLLAWLLGAVTVFFDGMEPPAIALWIAALGWTITKWRNERTRARILARVEAAPPSHDYRGPYRRQSDAVHVIHTSPGNLT